MGIVQQIDQDIAQSAKDNDRLKLSALRMLKNSLNNAAKESGKQPEKLDDHSAIAIIQKEIKQRRESADSYRQGDREELAEREESEIEYLSKYLPKQLGQKEVDEAIEAAISKSGAGSMADMGRVMSLLKEELAGQADMGQVSKLVKDKLSE